MASSQPLETDRKLFTVETANKTLPLVRAIVADIVEQWRVIKELQARLEPFEARRRGSNDEPYAEELAASQAELDAEYEKLRPYLEELDQLGIELKDIDQGLCDFRGVLDGREVYLCWKLGEPSVAHWHDLDSGFAGRRPIPGVWRPAATT